MLYRVFGIKGSAGAVFVELLCLLNGELGRLVSDFVEEAALVVLQVCVFRLHLPLAILLLLLTLLPHIQIPESSKHTHTHTQPAVSL